MGTRATAGIKRAGIAAMTGAFLGILFISLVKLMIYTLGNTTLCAVRDCLGDALIGGAALLLATITLGFPLLHIAGIRPAWPVAALGPAMCWMAVANASSLGPAISRVIFPAGDLSRVIFPLLPLHAAGGYAIAAILAQPWPPRRAWQALAIAFVAAWAMTYVVIHVR